MLFIPIGGVHAESYPKTTENGKEYYLYKVHKSEGFYSIGKRFKISREEIVYYNPETADGIKLGQILKIPITEENKSLTFQETEEFQEVPAYDIEDSGRTHRVKSKETLYGISNRYDVSVDDILALNPQAVKLEAGMTLRIPRKIKREDENIGIESRRLQNEKEKNAIDYADVATTGQSLADTESSSDQMANENNLEIAEIFSEAEDIAEKQGQQNLRVAIMMPFSLDSIKRDTNMKHFVDFYRGCLIAADSLKNNGMHITIDAYDIGKTAMELGSVLSNEELKNADIIIGPAYSSQIYYVADFAKYNDIRLIIPFTNNIKEVQDNNYIYQILCPQKQLYEKIANDYVSQWAGKTVLIVKPDTIGITYDKREFTDILIPKLQQAEIACEYISEKNLHTEVDSIAAIPDSINENGQIYTKTKEILLIIPTVNRPKLMELSEHISQIRSNKVSLFAFPEWDGYQLKELYVKPLYIFHNYKPNPVNEETQWFFATYYKRFGKIDKQTKPSFSLIGYDIMLYFGEQWKNSGKGMDYHLEADTKTQLSFDFERQGRGGYINKGVFYDIYGSNGIEQRN